MIQGFFDRYNSLFGKVFAQCFFGKKYLISIIFCLFIASCKTEEIYLYDKTGFTPERKFYTPNRSRSYDPYGRPHSRAYKNPYDFPSQNYHPYYDSDQYYVPPSYYNNVEPQQQFPIDTR